MCILYINRKRERKWPVIWSVFNALADIILAFDTLVLSSQHKPLSLNLNLLTIRT